MDPNQLIKTVTVLFLITTTPLALEWWNTNWQYKQLTHIEEDTNITKTPLMQLEIDTEELIQDQKAKNNCKDFRVISNQEKVPINLEDCNTTNTKILIDKTDLNTTQKPSNSTNITKPKGNTYIYYGNPNATEKPNKNINITYENEFEANSTDKENLKKEETTECDGFFTSCSKEDEYETSTSNELKTSHYHLNSFFEQQYSRKNRIIQSNSSLVFKDPIFNKNESGTTIISSKRKHWTNSSCPMSTNSTYSLHITDGTTNRLLFQEKKYGNGSNTDPLNRNSIGKIEYNEEKQIITYSYNWSLEENELNRVNMGKLNELKYNKENKEHEGWAIQTHSINTTDLDQLKLKIKTSTLGTSVEGSKSKGNIESNIYFIKVGKQNAPLDSQEAHPYYEPTTEKITPTQPIQNNDTYLDLNAWLEIHNRGEKPHNNITLPFNTVNLNKSKISNYTDKIISINPNTSKLIPMSFRTPLNVNETENPNDKTITIELSNELEHKIENLTFNYDKRENWINLDLYKCIQEPNCSTKNPDNWKKVPYKVENNTVVRKGDEMSQLTYKIEYQEETDESEETDEETDTASSSKTYCPQEKEEENEQEEKETIKNEEKTKRSVKILEPTESANQSFSVKAEAINDEECIIKLGEKPWEELERQKNVLTKQYTNVTPGKHKLNISCRYSSTSKTINVQEPKENPPKPEKRITEASAEQNNSKNTVLYLVIASLICLNLFELLRTRFTA